MNILKSKELFKEAQNYLVGGVNSPVRAFKAVGTDPIFIQRGKGSRIWDVDGNEYIDYVLSWGPLILGHAHDQVVNAIKQVANYGTSFGAPTELEIEMAKAVVDAVKSVEMVRFVNSGTEATMSAIRLARGYTKRKKIVKFDGCYHGHGDSLLVSAGSGVATLGIPGTPGIPEELANLTIVLPYNDIEAVEEAFKRYGEDIACVIIEPVAGNMGVVAPSKEYHQRLRDITRKYGALLIFDEVMTGFRLAYGGAQELYGIDPDLTTFGKVIGGGLPVGAYGGKREIMEYVAPVGPVYQAGTLSGNPLAMAAGLRQLQLLKELNPYRELDEKGRFLEEGFKQIAQEFSAAIQVNRVGSMITVFFTDIPVKDFATAKTSDTNKFAKFFRCMLEKGIYLPASQFEAFFLSTAHSQKDLEETLEKARECFKIL
ncbi:glutamate-1-semialdehyde-2,1-aminomutase [Sulfurihydrogenibium azorense Az-Fu1]|jgi:glutamate-1-semialdehyde 2,1-aminomutase|uniref:Glutamate-1-semialdehyde 2,1-aminomutase n=1 Tax=Sulfurihydrogenibium azorense (strain DSM 15241 / OCM 825 / Az-Fu1) TaxID=204536 RepID=GSA_SULAA|nr:glutamate-1-semialdehyde 2,1-aminomutase [Sulfurihydrogenibium azorense]C1DUY4.1 RecName: Full=Glutamate-1-semialdehyde 2,1-aminomutase; Short=GSA; AltName: Full=Glutamate-1-semialdehyde aminotransferase; Short=GSA-AT [Sulfurihydrogenibium azorense Az-Fu1]ACN98435.1 glutamate-1-semialdehyde-2,1-aminomutase [Sulfurihydrogenibium azorense Az-Fu1]MDM7274205.1 glutamate-1-semialdehyde 2,1-aminomutase [Sulfurihydrogenibium azorense]